MISEGHHLNSYNVSEKTLCNSAVRLVSSIICAHSAFTCDRAEVLGEDDARQSQIAHDRHHHPQRGVPALHLLYIPAI
jgi:hypothetical protein